MKVIENARKPFSNWVLPLILVAAACLVVEPAISFADVTRVVAPTPDWSKGALFGHVVDTATGHALPDATVALEDKDGHVLAWSKTDAQGQYAIAADSLSALRLRPSRRRGLLENMARGVGQVVVLPVHVVVDAVKEVDPVSAGKAAIVSSVTANPTPLAAQAVNTAARTVSDQTTATARGNSAKVVMGERLATAKQKRASLLPGEVFLSVAASGYKPLKDKAGAYWLEPPIPASADGQTPATGVRAWLETVKLAPETAPPDKKSEVDTNAILLSDAKADPSLAAVGTPIKLSVKLVTPNNQPLKLRVFAREGKKRTVVELVRQPGTPGIFAGVLPLDPGLGPCDSCISLIALRSEPIEVNLKDSKNDPLLEFARGLDDMDASKPYEFDPRIMASENRLDLPLSILDPRKATPSTPPSATPPSTPSAPPTTPPPPIQPAPAPPAQPPASPAKG